MDAQVRAKASQLKLSNHGAGAHSSWAVIQELDKSKRGSSSAGIFRACRRRLFGSVPVDIPGVGRLSER
ncbi:hypothetical protein GE21DRAFT_1223576 [Neurospora crassa]|nr:hypothetical protein GE21DRAFT_1223576 [Neurospora crassa]